MKRDLSDFHKHAHTRVARDATSMLNEMLKKNWLKLVVILLINIGLVGLLVWGIVQFVKP